MKSFKGNSDEKSTFTNLVTRVQAHLKEKKKDIMYFTHSLRVYTDLPREIKFTSFLLDRLAEKLGQKICSKIQESLDLYLFLCEYLNSFGFVIDEMTFESLSDDLLYYGLELCKEGTVQESFHNFKNANQKYLNAQFIMDELTRELFHSLKFSTEESGDDAAKVASPSIGGHDNQRIKSFTFDVGHAKIAFTNGDEAMINDLKRLIKDRISSYKGNE